MTYLERRRMRGLPSPSKHADILTAQKKFSPSSPDLEVDLFEPGGPQVGPKTKAVVNSSFFSSKGKKRKIVHVTISVERIKKKRKAKRSAIDNSDLGEEPGITLNSAELSYLVNKRRKHDDEKERMKTKKTEVIKKTTKRGVIDSDSDSNSDDSDIPKPWIKDVKSSPSISCKVEEKNIAKTKIGNVTSFDKINRKDGQVTIPPSNIPKKKKPSALDGVDEKKSKGPIQPIPKKKKTPNVKSDQELPLISSSNLDEKESEASMGRTNIRKKKASTSQLDQELQLSSSVLNTKIARKETKQEAMGDSLITQLENVPKIGKYSPSKNPSKPSLHGSSTDRVGDNQSQAIRRRAGEGSAPRSKMNLHQNRHQKRSPYDGSPSKQLKRSRDSSKTILKDLNKIIRKVLFHQEGKGVGVAEVDQVEALGSNNSKEFKSNAKHTEEGEYFDFFDRNDDGTVIIDTPLSMTSCVSSKFGSKDCPLSWWGILSPPDNIMAVHKNMHPLVEKETRIINSTNMDEESPTGHGHGNVAKLNNSPHPQGYWGGRVAEGQRFANGCRNNWVNDGARHNWGNIGGRDLAAGAELDGPGWKGVPDDYHTNTQSFDRGLSNRSGGKVRS